jgi:hypothetical protein
MQVEICSEGSTRVAGNWENSMVIINRGGEWAVPEYDQIPVALIQFSYDFGCRTNSCKRLVCCLEFVSNVARASRMAFIAYLYTA